MKARVLIFDLDTGTEESPGTRGPKYHLNGSGKRVFDNPIAIIWDPGDLGVGDIVNTPGTMFFTLPHNHPQADLIKPLKVHYRVEIKRNGAWEALDDNTDGIITKLDATGNEVVYYGLNYVGLVDRTFEQRYKPGLGGDVPIAQGGSKYVNKTIDFVIRDQLVTEAAITSSPIGFIAAPDLPGWTETINIYAVFKQRLQFISGLMDSHIADTSRRPRLRVERNSNHAGYDATTMNEQYQWVFGDVAGTAVDDLKLEYGALINGFRVIPINDNFATKGLGIGRTQEGTIPQYATSVPVLEGGGNFPTWEWGSFPIVSFFDDIIDPIDLERRTARLARRAGQFGQAVGLALATNGIEPVRQWQLLDRFPIVIDRGVIHTELYNDGYWTAVGWQWRLFRDGHPELVITFEPHDTLSTSITPDLVTGEDKPSIGGSVRVGCGVPEVNPTWNERIYYDRCSGLTYLLAACGDVPILQTETFTRTVDPWVLNRSEFVTDGFTREWGTATGLLASSMRIDGSAAAASLTSNATGQYAQASIPIIADSIELPVEVLVKWEAQVPLHGVGESTEAGITVFIMGQAFAAGVKYRTGTTDTYDNGDVSGPISAYLDVSVGYAGGSRRYSNTGSTLPLGTGEFTYYPAIDPETAIWTRMRVEAVTPGTVHVMISSWFDGESEPGDWVFESDEVDAPSQALTLQLYPHGSPFAGPLTTYTVWCDSIELYAFMASSDYCWGVKPPIPWIDGDPTYPFPATGMIVPRHKVSDGDGVTQYFYTGIRGTYLPYDPLFAQLPYQAGSLRVDVDGIYCNIAETTPGSGLFFLPFAPLSSEEVFAEWREG